MVKTKVIAKKGIAALKRPEPPTKKELSAYKKEMDKKRKINAAVHTEVPANKKGVDRPARDWWEDIMSGETCRTGDIEKVQAAITRSHQERKGLNIQTNPERNGTYFWYISRIYTDSENMKGRK